MHPGSTSNTTPLHASPQALGSKGLAVSVLPPESTLEPWNRLVLVVSCFNDMCGAYMDKLHVKVGAGFGAGLWIAG